MFDSRDGSMIVRWVPTAVRDAERKFRRLRGHKYIPRLVAALDAHQRSLQVDAETRAKEGGRDEWRVAPPGHRCGLVATDWEQRAGLFAATALP